MFGLSRNKEPWQTVTCKGLKLDGHAAKALLVTGLDLPAMCKAADTSEYCTKVGIGRIYQKPGTMLDEHNPETQSYAARYDSLTRTLGINLHQGLMRQTIIFATREPVLLAAELGISLEQATPSEPTVS